MVSGLRVNFLKSSIVCIDGDLTWAQFVTQILNCKCSCAPFKYIGLPIGGTPRRKSLWTPIVNRIEERLCNWKNKFLFWREVNFVEGFTCFYPNLLLISFQNADNHFFKDQSYSEKIFMVRFHRKESYLLSQMG